MCHNLSIIAYKLSIKPQASQVSSFNSRNEHEIVSERENFDNSRKRSPNLWYQNFRTHAIDAWIRSRKAIKKRTRRFCQRRFKLTRLVFYDICEGAANLLNSLPRDFQVFRLLKIISIFSQPKLEPPSVDPNSNPSSESPLIGNVYANIYENRVLVSLETKAFVMKLLAG